MRKFLYCYVWLLIGGLTITTSTAYAVQLTCTGKVQALGLVTTQSDHILIRIGTDSWNTGLMRYCRLTTARAGLSPEQCNALYSMLLTAKVAGKSITINYSVDAGGSCGQIANWETPDPSPFHFYLND